MRYRCRFANRQPSAPRCGSPPARAMVSVRWRGSGLRYEQCPGPQIAAENKPGKTEQPDERDELARTSVRADGQQVSGLLETGDCPSMTPGVRGGTCPECCRCSVEEELQQPVVASTASDRCWAAYAFRSSLRPPWPTKRLKPVCRPLPSGRWRRDCGWWLSSRSGAVSIRVPPRSNTMIPGEAWPSCRISFAGRR